MTSRLTISNRDEDMDSSVSVLEGFPNSRVSSTVHTLKSSARVPEDASFRPLKRRRAVGINSRYDNMIDQVRILSGPRASSTSSRRRVYSSGSSSISDVPKTPLSAYSGIQEGRLGKNFTLIKMKKPAAQSSSPSQTGDYLKADTTLKSLPPMPDWLNDTLLGLQASHPLRRLMSTTNDPLPAEPPLPVGEVQGLNPNQNEIEDEDASVFAFQPPRLDSLPLDDSDPNTDVATEFASDNLSEFSVRPADLLLVPAPNADYDYAVRGPDALPFSTPGPASHDSVARYFDAQPAQVFSDDIYRAFSHPGPASSLSSFSPQHVRDASHLEESGVQYPTLLAQSPVVSSSPLYAHSDTPPFLFKHLPAYVISPSSSPPPSSTHRNPHLKQDISIPTALRISNHFSTPGPTYRKSPHTSSSPSSAIQYDFVSQVDVDPASLDFHWAPFIRDRLADLQDGVAEGDGGYSASAHSGFQLRPRFEGNHESSDIYSPVNNEHSPPRSGSDGHLPVRLQPTQSPDPEPQHSFYHHKWTKSDGAGPEVYSLEPNIHIDERHSDKAPAEGQISPSPSTSNTEEFDWEVLPLSGHQPVGRASTLLPISETRGTHVPDPRPPLGAFAPAPGIFVSPLRAPGGTGSRKSSEDRGIQPLERRTQESSRQNDSPLLNSASKTTQPDGQYIDEPPANSPASERDSIQSWTGNPGTAGL